MDKKNLNAVREAAKKVIFFSGAATKALPPPLRAYWQKDLFLVIKQLTHLKTILFRGEQSL